MSISKNQYSTLLLFILSSLILLGIFKWINYLVENGYFYMASINEGLTTTSSCSNFCGPTARCFSTGQQCTSDIDCPGCQSSPPQSQTDSQYTPNVPGNDNAGKLDYKPGYSTLTSDIGSTATIYNDKLSKPVQANFGENTWIDKFNESRQLFDKRYKPAGLENMPSYPNRPSATGEFIDEGPLASNDYLK
uniref:Uncharacterized protein n=1 Tax=viral metagenome TaxID=1070528 RepID=A0A6C0IFD0_9ZZZZ